MPAAPRPLGGAAINRLDSGERVRGMVAMVRGEIPIGGFVLAMALIPET